MRNEGKERGNQNGNQMENVKLYTIYKWKIYIHVQHTIKKWILLFSMEFYMRKIQSDLISTTRNVNFMRIYVSIFLNITNIIK